VSHDVHQLPLGRKLSETVKGKLSKLGARILQAGDVERVFRQVFSAEKGERLVKALQSYLYTPPVAPSLGCSSRVHLQDHLPQ
jgi:hypothetical protein